MTGWDGGKDTWYEEGSERLSAIKWFIIITGRDKPEKAVIQVDLIQGVVQ